MRFLTSYFWPSWVVEHISFMFSRSLISNMALVFRCELPHHRLIQLHMYNGLPGKKWETCEEIQVNCFESHRSQFLSGRSQYRTGQKYVSGLCRAVQSGDCLEDLEGRSRGKLSHNRWVTTADRVICLYVFIASPYFGHLTGIYPIVKA